MSHAASIRALILAVALVIVTAPAAHAGTIVFDFEDGLQGWDLRNAFRRDHSVLGETYAIFGRDRSRMSIELDLTDIRAMSMERLFSGDDPLRQNFVYVRLEDPDPFLPERSISLGFGESLLRMDLDVASNPDVRGFDLSSFTGLYRVVISWNGLFCIPEDIGPCLQVNFPGYVDNITFDTIPEPSVLVLLAMAGVAARARRRARGGRLT